MQSHLDAERAKLDAEKARAINHNMKIFQEAVKAGLDKPDEEIFNAEVDQAWTVREAKREHQYHHLYRKMVRLLFKNDQSYLNKLQFRTLVQAFTK